MNRRTLLAGLAAASTRAAVAQPAKRLIFTAIPDQDETRLVERFGRVATYLEAALGTPVGYVPVKSYPAAVTAFTNDQVQLAWFGGVNQRPRMVSAITPMPCARTIAARSSQRSFGGRWAAVRLDDDRDRARGDRGAREGHRSHAPPACRWKARPPGRAAVALGLRRAIPG